MDIQHRISPWSAYVTDDGCDSGFGFGTPREWGRPVFRLYDGDSDQVADVVRNLNAHDDLLAALRDALSALDRKQPTSACTCDANLGSREQSGNHAIDCPVGVILAARAAIAKAVQS